MPEYWSSLTHQNLSGGYIAISITCQGRIYHPFPVLCLGRIYHHYFRICVAAINHYCQSLSKEDCRILSEENIS